MIFFIIQSATHESDSQPLISNDSLVILSRFPNMNLSPVVVLEDVLKKAHRIRRVGLEFTQGEIDRNGHAHEHINQYESTEICDQSQKKAVNKNQPLKLKIFRCSIEACQNQYLSKKSLNRHKALQHGIHRPKCKCNVCHEQKAVIPNNISTPTIKYKLTNGDKVNTKSASIQHPGNKSTDENIERNFEIIKVGERPIERSSNQERRKPNTEIRCEKCFKIFPSKRRKRYHLTRFHDGIGAFPCSVCMKIFSNVHSLQCHMYRAHNPNARKIECDQCGSLFLSKTEVRTHIDGVHLNKRKFKCKTCQFQV